jgi:hypothetical protein
MDVSVLIPFASDDQWRRLALEHVAAGYEQHGWEIVIGTVGGEWVKAVAVEDAARRASGDVFVVADADCLCDGTPDAVQAVIEGAAWAMPHCFVHRFSDTATEKVYAGGYGDELEEPAYHGRWGGGIVVLPRSTWSGVPLDPRFKGWGQEDEAWALALTSLAGEPVRLAHDLWHLWHPTPPRLNRRVGSDAGVMLRQRYLDCRLQPDRMTVLVNEAIEALRKSGDVEEVH